MNIVTHCRQEHGIFVMSVPQNMRAGPKPSHVLHRRVVLQGGVAPSTAQVIDGQPQARMTLGDPARAAVAPNLKGKSKPKPRRASSKRAD